MLWEIIRKEMLDNISSPKFVFTFLLCTILILLSVYTGVNNYRAELREYNAAVALNKKNLELGKKALQRASKKLACTCSIEVEEAKK